MAKGDVWTMIHDERKALAEDLEGLDDAQWGTRSLCSEWTVRDVLAHMTATAKISAGQFLPKLAASGFSLRKMQTKDIAAQRGAGPADTLAAFAAEVTSSKHPPGPAQSWLGEVIVHAEDIRRPLGLAHDYPKDAVIEVADFYKGSNLIIGAKRRVAGLQLRATDTKWFSGDGPEVTGPVVSLVLAMTGRRAAIDDLSGDGVTTLRARS